MSDDKENAILIASIPPVVYTILDNLPAIHLNKCAQVCTLWRDIVNSIKRRRRRFSWFFYHYRHGRALHCLPCYPKNQSLTCFVSFLKHLNNLPSEPALTLAFCSRSMMHQPEPFFPTCLARKRKLDSDSPDVFGNLYPFFPSNSDIGFFTARGVTRTSSSTREIEFYPSLSVLYFPTLPGINIYSFPLCDLGNTAPSSHSGGTSIPQNLPIKCLLVFLPNQSNDCKCLPYNDAIERLLDKQDWKIAIGGACIDYIFFPKHKPEQSNQCFGIAFAGENIEAASIVITQDMDTEQRIEEHMKLIIDSDILKGQCFAFMFTDVERSTRCTNDYHTMSFHRVFPNVPLFGVIGSREIGTNYVPNIDSKQIEKQGPSIEYASTFVIISVRS